MTTKQELVDKLRGIHSSAAIQLHRELTDELGEDAANALWEQAADALAREQEERSDGPVHAFFSFSYCAYQVVPRVLAQSMPHAWQDRFVRCIEELQAAFGYLGDIEYDVHTAESVYVNELTEAQQKLTGVFCIEGSPEGSDGYYDRDGNELNGYDRVMVPVADPLPSYSRGRTRVPRADQRAQAGGES